MRDFGTPRSTTRISARSTSSRPGGLLARLLLQRFLRTQTSQSTPVVFPGANPPTLKSDMKVRGTLATGLMAFSWFSLLS